MKVYVNAMKRHLVNINLSNVECTQEASVHFWTKIKMSHMSTKFCGDLGICKDSLYSKFQGPRWLEILQLLTYNQIKNLVWTSLI